MRRRSLCAQLGATKGFRASVGIILVEGRQQVDVVLFEFLLSIQR